VFAGESCQSGTEGEAFGIGPREEEAPLGSLRDIGENALSFQLGRKQAQPGLHCEVLARAARVLGGNTGDLGEGGLS
jgi:hypothetical protein